MKEEKPIVECIVERVDQQNKWFYFTTLKMVEDLKSYFLLSTWDHPIGSCEQIS